MSTVVVTGGAGFIGSHLVDALAARGDDVVVLDDLSTGVRENLAEGVRLVQGDVADTEALRDALENGADAVLHTAGQASIAHSFSHPERDLRANVSGTLAVIDACLQWSVPRLVYASSMTVYGEPTTVPTSEDEPCRPLSYYGVTKYAAERYVQIAGERTDIDLSVTSLRMFNVFGERQRLDNPYQGVLAIFIGNALRGESLTIHSDGLQTRDFVYVGDVVDAWLRVLDDDATRGRVFNVGSGSETSIGELAGAVLARVGLDGHPIEHAPPQLGDLRRSGADVRALERATGWEPRTSLADGLAKTLAWARG